MLDVVIILAVNSEIVDVWLIIDTEEKLFLTAGGISGALWDVFKEEVLVSIRLVSVLLVTEENNSINNVKFTNEL